MGQTIFLSSGGRTKRLEWNGKSFEDLALLYFEAFSLEKDKTKIQIRRGHFYLKHKDFNVFFEGFELDEIKPGAVIDVRGPHALEFGAASWEVDPDATGSVLSLSGEGSETDSNNGEDEQNMSTPDLNNSDLHSYQPSHSLREKIWKTLDNPDYSWLAKQITIFIMVTIMVSTSAFVLETIPMFKQSSGKGSVWYIIEAVCIAVFTLELTLRIACAPPTLLSLRPLNLSFFTDLMNVIDIVAVLPFYVELGLANAAVPGLAVLRVVRLVRIFRLFKVSKSSATIFLVTMKRSAKPLYMLIFFTSLALTIFSSLMYYAERGTYDSDLKTWTRAIMYKCELTVTVKLGDPVTENSLLVSQAWLSDLDTEDLAGSGCEPIEGNPGNATQRNFTCEYEYRYNYEAEGNKIVDENNTLDFAVSKHDCIPVLEVSPFESIPATMWWCLVTMTTVGYGDIAPVRWYGRLLGMVVMLSGILVIALPITVIGSNFADVYQQMVISKRNKPASEPVSQPEIPLKADQRRQSRAASAHPQERPP